ncbi:Lysozyme M1 precursor [Hartmannibacter diazotrophicus]|uniref:Lysozyme M1 n=1 Tax=Hartmannibacter diazotrophicus TaxID=1482074 RepID=A0A2C9D4N8_9HYPH|nr:GH25 family lysozyme [Hartmannibacter diazotrophicus]SON55118.1 Lysozyme M1 precursor [Hartmannibacter diazotrophicus]
MVFDRLKQWMGNAGEFAAGKASDTRATLRKVNRRPVGRIAVAMVTAGLLSGCALFEFEEPGPETYPVQGIDVSKYQGDIDWNAVHRAGISFAYIKATEGGDHKDDRFLDNWNAAKAAGVRHGAYHFYYFCRSPEEQAAWFIQNVPYDPTALPPVLDMEWYHDSKTCKRKPSREEVLSEMKTFIEMVARYYGKRPIVYATVDFHRDRLVNAWQGYPMWLRSVAGHPSIRYGKRTWHLWQYTATGRVKGIRGNVDRNTFAGSKKDFEVFLASSQLDVATGSIASQQPAVPAAAATAVANAPDPTGSGVPMPTANPAPPTLRSSTITAFDE